MKKIIFCIFISALFANANYYYCYIERDQIPLGYELYSSYNYGYNKRSYGYTSDTQVIGVRVYNPNDSYDYFDIGMTWFKGDENWPVAWGEDEDGDGMPDNEPFYDEDGDGIPDDQDEFLNDHDNDGVNDDIDNDNNDPFLPDTDGDGTVDPLDPEPDNPLNSGGDQDGDGVSDEDEIAGGSDPVNPFDGGGGNSGAAGGGTSSGEDGDSEDGSSEVDPATADGKVYVINLDGLEKSAEKTSTELDAIRKGLSERFDMSISEIDKHFIDFSKEQILGDAQHAAAFDTALSDQNEIIVNSSDKVADAIDNIDINVVQEGTDLSGVESRLDEIYTVLSNDSSQDPEEPDEPGNPDDDEDGSFGSDYSYSDEAPDYEGVTVQADSLDESDGFFSGLISDLESLISNFFSFHFPDVGRRDVWEVRLPNLGPVSMPPFDVKLSMFGDIIPVLRQLLLIGLVIAVTFRAAKMIGGVFS